MRKLNWIDVVMWILFIGMLILNYHAVSRWLEMRFG